MDKQKETLTVAETAELLGCSKQAVRMRISPGGIWDSMGDVIDNGNGYHKTYIIYRSRVYKYINKEGPTSC